MNLTRKELRADFYAKTDISVSIQPESWKKYAEWLEGLAVEKINEELLVKYEKLLKRVDNVIGILEEGITER